MVLAILFYVGLGALIFYAIWGPKDEKPGTAGQTGPSRASPAVSSQPPKNGNHVLIAGGVVGLLVVLGLAWAGGKYGSGNSLFPKGGGSAGYQPTRQPPAPRAVWVDSYYRQDGTFVPGHWRSAPDGDPSNNWSNSPNVNPSTGKPGTHHPKSGR